MSTKAFTYNKLNGVELLPSNFRCPFSTPHLIFVSLKLFVGGLQHGGMPVLDLEKFLKKWMAKNFPPVIATQASPTKAEMEAVQKALARA